MSSLELVITIPRRVLRQRRGGGGNGSSAMEGGGGGGSMVGWGRGHRNCVKRAHQKTTRPKFKLHEI
jgi:hypothetical protein